MDSQTTMLTEFRKISSSLSLPNRKLTEWNKENENGTLNEFEAKAYAHTLKAPYLWDKSDKDRLQILSVAVGTVFHRYTGQEKIPLISSSNSSFKSTGKISQEMSILNFGLDSSFQDVMEQLQKSESMVVEDESLMPQGSTADQNLFRFGVTATSAGNHPVGSSSFEIFVILRWQEASTEPTFLLSIEFKPDIYTHSQMERLATHLTTILEFLSPATILNPVQTLPMLSENERYQLLTQFNGIYSDDTSFLENETSLLSIFAKNLNKNGDKVAIIEGSGDDTFEFSYAQVYSRAYAIFELLTAFEQNDSSFVALFVPQGFHAISASLATFMFGKTAAVFHSSYASAQVESCLEQLGNPVLVTTRPKMESIKIEYKSIFLIDEQNTSGLEKSPTRRTPTMNSNANAYCFFTSGSTGKPKAALLSSISVLNTAHFLARKFGFDESDRVACLTPPGFVLTVFDIWLTFYVSGTLCIPSDDVRLNVEKLRPWLHQRSVTTFWISTAVGDVLLRCRPEDEVYFSKLRWIFIGGERLQCLDLTGQNFRCCQAYGSTEACLITLKILTSKCEWPTVGNSISNTSIYVLDSELNLVPIGVHGDIYVSGIGIMTGYYNRDRNSVLIENPFKPGSKMFCMGDVGYWTEDGELVVIGRKDSQVKVHGMRLELGEIESVLSQYPVVKQAIVILRKIGRAKQLIAFCTLHEGAMKPKMGHLYAFLESRLQRHAIPLQIHFVSEFPKTASGKVARNALAKTLEVENEGSKEISFAHRRVRLIWAEVIGVPENVIGEDSDFFRMGGNSMLASRVTQVLSLEFPFASLPKIFRFPALNEYVDSISIDEPNETAPNFESEIELDLSSAMKSLSYENGLEVPLNQIKDVLVTGGTGYVGPMLLIRILSSTSYNTIAIIRGISQAEAEKRLVAAFASQGLTTFFHQFKDRIQVIAGDLTKPCFGMDSSDYELLCQRVDSIYHSAAEVNFVKRYFQLRESTVAMTRNVIQFAVSRKLKCIHYLSTVAVFDGIPLHEGTVYVAKEEPLPPESRPEAMRTGYNQSKWVGEKLIWKAIEQGVPAKIYRVGEVGASTKFNIVNKEDALGGFLLACKRMQKYPNIEMQIPYVGLDATAQWIVTISLTAPANPNQRAFHIVEQELDIKSFIEADEETTYETVTLDLWDEEFLTQTQFKGKDTVGAWLFLKSIQSSKERDTVGYITRNIEFSLKETGAILGGIPNEDNPASTYIQKLFN